MKSGFGKNNFSRVDIHDSERNSMNNASLQIASRSNGIYGQIIHRRIPKAKPARIRRDQRAVCFAARAARRAYASRRRPFCFSNRALVTSLHGAGPQERRASVRGSAAGRCASAPFRYALLAASAPLAPLADHRPKPRFYRRGGRDARRDSACCSNNSRVRPTSAASEDSLGNAVWYSRTSILLPKPSIA
jgi:hypothetical protein